MLRLLEMLLTTAMDENEISSILDRYAMEVHNAH